MPERLKTGEMRDIGENGENFGENFFPVSSTVFNSITAPFGATHLLLLLTKLCKEV